MTEDMPAEKPRKPSLEEKRRMKSAARLYAVQALFQMEAGGLSVDKVRAEFENFRFGAVIDDVEMSEGNVDLFRRILDDAVMWQGKIDKATDKALLESWPLNRIDSVLRALFRAAGAELVNPATPPKVVINEFVEVARAFFPDGREPKFVNAVIDNMARQLRDDLV
ncbi:transcription antitermination factor NusB [Thioclava sp. GXIMD4216]|uniref:Transcription antitermination protein NusB n=1 Tax=Thioclava litoralis TaxID=3076557 RepID=A0ABZ1E124_9RHOB|nr:transcription antitermination factor NusB [Thioclava sp. FTW29]